MNERKPEGGTEVMIFCYDFEPMTPRTPTTGPIDASQDR